MEDIIIRNGLIVDVENEKIAKRRYLSKRR